MDIVLRALTVFFFVFLLTRVAGRRELGSLEPFDLIMLVVIGDLVQQALTQDDYSVVGALLAGSTIGLLTVVVSYVHYRVPRLRPVLEGEPVILLEDGRPIESILRRERITVDELAEAARQQQGLASLDDVQWAVLETSGQISVIPKQQ
jgi:uncharacterized membrane protein YcaP (DUF421 family)